MPGRRGRHRDLKGNLLKEEVLDLYPLYSLPPPLRYSKRVYLAPEDPKTPSSPPFRFRPSFSQTRQGKGVRKFIATCASG